MIVRRLHDSISTTASRVNLETKQKLTEMVSIQEERRSEINTPRRSQVHISKRAQTAARRLKVPSQKTESVLQSARSSSAVKVRIRRRKDVTRTLPRHQTTKLADL